MSLLIKDVVNILGIYPRHMAPPFPDSFRKLNPVVRQFVINRIKQRVIRRFIDRWETREPTIPTNVINNLIYELIFDI